MLDQIWLVPALPFLGFVVLALWGGRMSRATIATIGVGSVGLSAVYAIITAIEFFVAPPLDHIYTLAIWKWLAVGFLDLNIAFYLDPLALIFVLVITVVGFLIHLYSAEFMIDEEGYSRFFAYMNLFVGSMLMLVLADNLLLLYLGWEGVGLCSYLLIGFWYKDPANGYAARKAFIVTRVGDVAMALGLFLLFTQLHTLNIQELMQNAAAQWAVGSSLAIAAAALLLGGAVGKSAQLPLQTWLPDAMAGPSPVSALIHAATMVTAGVYLIARTHMIFELAPVVQAIVAIIGALTLLLAGFAALTQVDIKRVLAYSTISQIGYMFLALGVGAWSAGIFHFMTHAFFKALLFLGAGVVIHTLRHEHNMFKMGGLRSQLPVTFWTYLIGSASLAALPLVTAGFYSKDLILWYAWSGEKGSPWLWAAGFLGAFLTAVYTFRMVFVTFFGEAKAKISHKPGVLLKLPLIVLATLATIGGLVELPHTFGHFTPFSDFLHFTLPKVASAQESISQEWLMQLLAAAVSLFGLYLAYYFYIKKPDQTERLSQNPAFGGVRRFWFSGWGFDWLYDRVFVRPLVYFAVINKNDFIDLLYTGIAESTRFFHGLLRQTQTGRLRWYAVGIAIGAILTLSLMVW